MMPDDDDANVGRMDFPRKKIPNFCKTFRRVVFLLFSELAILTLPSLFAISEVAIPALTVYRQHLLAISGSIVFLPSTARILIFMQQPISSAEASISMRQPNQENDTKQRGGK